MPVTPGAVKRTGRGTGTAGGWVSQVSVRKAALSTADAAPYAGWRVGRHPGGRSHAGIEAHDPGGGSPRRLPRRAGRRRGVERGPAPPGEGADPAPERAVRGVAAPGRG